MVELQYGGIWEHSCVVLNTWRARYSSEDTLCNFRRVSHVPVASVFTIFVLEVVHYYLFTEIRKVLTYLIGYCGSKELLLFDVLHNARHFEVLLRSFCCNILIFAFCSKIFRSFWAIWNCRDATTWSFSSIVFRRRFILSKRSSEEISSFLLFLWDVSGSSTGRGRLAGGLRTGVDVASSLAVNENTDGIASSLSFFDPVYR